jgi:hypothetical protein
MGKKYLVKPGHVISESDGDEHYISFTQLTRLYGVDPDECLNNENLQMRGYPPNWNTDNLITLEPKYDGNYTIPTTNPKKSGE